MVSHMNLTFLRSLSSLAILNYLVMIKLLKVLLLLLFPPNDPLQQYMEDHENDTHMQERNEIDEIFLRQPAILKHNLPVEPLGILSKPKEDPVFDLKPLPDTPKYAYLDEN